MSTEQPTSTNGLQRLRDRDDSASRALADAMDPELATGPVAREWFERIEARRRALSTSTRMVVIPPGEFGNRTGTEPLRETASRLCQASKGPKWGELLYRVIYNFQPRNALELGTCLGISAAYQGAALRAIPGGRLVTLDGMKPRMAVAEETLSQLGLTGTVGTRLGMFQQTLPAVLEELRPVDYAFIDGHHDEDATVAYWNLLLPYLADSAVVVFDDIDWSDGMRAAWTRLVGDERAAVKILIGTASESVGVCLVGGVQEKEVLRLPLRL